MPEFCYNGRTVDACLQTKDRVCGRMGMGWTLELSRHGRRHQT